MSNTKLTKVIGKIKLASGKIDVPLNKWNKLNEIQTISNTHITQNSSVIKMDRLISDTNNSTIYLPLEFYDEKEIEIDDELFSIDNAREFYENTGFYENIVLKLANPLSPTFNTLAQKRLGELKIVSPEGIKYKLYNNEIFNFIEWVIVPDEENVMRASKDGINYYIIINKNDEVLEKFKNNEPLTKNDFNIIPIKNPVVVVGNENDKNDKESNTALILGGLVFLAILFMGKK